MRVRRQHLLLRALIGILALVLAVVATRQCLRSIVVQEEKQVEQTMLDVGEQTGGKLQAVLDASNRMLSAMCVQMSDEADPAYLIDQFRVLVDVYHVERIGFIDPDGLAYTTDGVYADLSDYPPFRRSMAGDMYLSDVMVDHLSATPQNVNICSAPVYRQDSGELMGVMFTAYRTEIFSQLLQVGSFDGQGTSCIFQSDGTLVATTGGDAPAPGENLFDSLVQGDPDNRSSVDALRRHIADKAPEALLLTFSNDQQEDYFHIMEMSGRPGWYLATIVPTDVLSQRTDPLLGSVQTMIALVTALLLIFGAVYLWTYHSQRKELHRLAYVDPITGGHNYAAFAHRLEGGVGVSGAGYIVSADLRDFDSINDTCGIQRGNEVIRAMHAVLCARLDKGELCARVVADRFVLFLHADSQEALVARLALWRDEIAAISAQQGIPQIMSKFGVRAVSSPDHPESAYRDINLALRRLNERVDYFYVIFNDEDRSRASETHDLETRFDKALSKHRFEMWFQPKYAPDTGKLVAAEALVRWRRADGKLIAPGKFIPLFERNGMIAQLDEYTFNAVCAQQRFWLDKGRAVVPVSVNLSRVSLMFPDIAQRLTQIAQSHGLPTRYVELEITESAMEGRANIGEVISQLRAQGFRIQMDDFGSGYSSLSTLTTGCFDNVKIDKSLVDGIGQPSCDALLTAIIQLVHQLGMTVTAEGAERQEQIDLLTDLACDNIQGYYYSRPLPIGEFEKLLV